MASSNGSHNGTGTGTAPTTRKSESSVIRLGAVSDLHYAKGSQGMMQSLFAEIDETVDILVLCGDLTDFGLADEARVLAKDLAAVHVPVIAVLGNHDFEGGEEKDIVDIITSVGVRVLDGDTVEVHGVGFAGVRGFCGGFGRGALGPWGEPVIKAFVNEAVQEALKLESALQRLRTEHRIVLMHYSPVRETVEGEPLEIFPFLGSSRLEEPLVRLGATAVFHGHAHRGAPEGKTSTGVPVFNVCHQVLTAHYPDRPPYRIFELRAPTDTSDASVVPADAARGRRLGDRTASLDR
jgi:Icc-related predicted phosphoesterase